MGSETTKSETNGLRSYGAEPVNCRVIAFRLVRLMCGFEAAAAVATGKDLTFAHVLNVPSSEELWPGDVAELISPEYFATRYVGDDEVFRHRDGIWEHMREEILRLADLPECRTLESIWQNKVLLDYHELKGSFPEDSFCDGCEDEEDDTLNSELLLTEEYVGPEKPVDVDHYCGWCGRKNCPGGKGECRDNALDSVNDVQDHVNYYDQFYDPPLRPQRPVRISLPLAVQQPIEQED